MNDRRIPTIHTPEEEYPVPPPGSETVNPAPETEFSTPDTSQEFDQSGGITEEAEDKSSGRLKKIRRLLYGAAAIALGFVLLTPEQNKNTGEDLSETAGLTVAESTAPPAVPAGEAALPTERPATPVPTPVPSDTPVFVPEKPEANAVFVQFSSEFHGFVYLSHVETVRSVTAELWERNLEELVQSNTWEEGDPAISAGVLQIPVFDEGSLYFNHMDYYSSSRIEPEIEMKVCFRYALSDGGPEESIELTEQAAPEEGVYARYWGSGSFAREEGYPDCFEIGTYSESESRRFVIDRPDLVTEPGVISVSAECGGRKVAEAECRTEIRQPDPELQALGFDSEPKTILLIPRADWMQDSGTLTVTITQYLEHYGCTLTKTLEIGFSGQIDDASYGTLIHAEIGGLPGGGS